VNQNKWSVLKIIMVVLSSLFILSRISIIFYMLDYSGLPILGYLIFPLLFDIGFLCILIFAPSKYRFLAIIPLLYFVVASAVRLINFINTTDLTNFPSFFTFQYIGNSVLLIIAFITYSILLLPTFKYQLKHAILAGTFLVPVAIIYFMNVVSNMGYLFQQNPFEYIYRYMIVNFLSNTAIYVIFTLYILDHTKKEQVIIE